MSAIVAGRVAEPPPEAYDFLESSFTASPHIRSHKALPRHRDDVRTIFPLAQPLKIEPSSSDDEATSQASSDDRTPLATPGVPNGADTGLPPTPPTNINDDEQPANLNPSQNTDSMRSSMASRKSSLSTPVNQRSPPTPDPSPPRTAESLKLPVRPFISAYPSSRAESFKTAREDQLSTDGSSRAPTPLASPLRAANERGLGLAFEQEDSDTTPTNDVQNPFPNAKVQHSVHERDTVKGNVRDQQQGDVDQMQNVTVRKKRSLKQSPLKNLDSPDRGSQATRPKHSTSEPRRRVASSPSQASPNVQSIEAFANAIGWPTEPKTPKDPVQPDAKRHSGTSMASTVVEAMVIVTPPQNRRRTLRHSGKNLAYRGEDDSSTEHSSMTQSNRTSMNSDELPLHRLIHKRASISDRKKRFSSDSTAGTFRTSSPLSVHHYTVAHQDSVRNVLQPAAESMSRSSSLSRPYLSERSNHKRISSAPEPVRKVGPLGPRTFMELSPTQDRGKVHTSFKSPLSEEVLPPTRRDEAPFTGSPKARSSRSDWARNEMNVERSLPHRPLQYTDELVVKKNVSARHKEQDKYLASHDAASTMHEEPSVSQQQSPKHGERTPLNGADSPRAINTNLRRGSLSSTGRSDERRQRSSSRERTPASRDSMRRPSLDRIPTEELPRRSYESRSLHVDDPRRISGSTSRSEEHAMARHLFAANTPFSQVSHTPIEVSEATAVSIYPHNNHSLLVVQQIARSNTLSLEEGAVHNDDRASYHELSPSQTRLQDVVNEEPTGLDQPMVTIEPSTPPRQLAIPVPGAVDSPLKNPRAAPEPPVIKFIPPTPADELERQLGANPPGPPTRSDSHPQRRLSLVQRARRYSEDLISPFLKGRSVSDNHQSPRVPTVNDADGALHPFWRPRGFWDGFEDSDSDDGLPQGGDTSDVDEPEPEPNPRKLGVLGRKLTNGVKASGGFLIGNSLGVERSGTNRRRSRVELPSRRSSSPPIILVQRPTLPLAMRTRVEKRGSQASMRSPRSSDRALGTRRETWRNGKKLPGVKLQVQYIGLSGVKERLRDRKAEKRRNEIRKSIGSRYFIEDGPKVA